MKSSCFSTFNIQIHIPLHFFATIVSFFFFRPPTGTAWISLVDDTGTSKLQYRRHKILHDVVCVRTHEIDLRLAAQLFGRKIQSGASIGQDIWNWSLLFFAKMYLVCFDAPTADLAFEDDAILITIIIIIIITITVIKTLNIVGNNLLANVKPYTGCYSTWKLTLAWIMFSSAHVQCTARISCKKCYLCFKETNL